MRHIQTKLRISALVACWMFAGASRGQEQTSSLGKATDPRIREAYSRHFAIIQQMLPPHSALPPLLNLTKSKLDLGGKDRAWEKGYNLLTDAGVDPGMHGPIDATSTGRAFYDYFGRPNALPARSSEAVIIGEPVASEALISHNRETIYSRFSVKVLNILKAKRKAGIHEGADLIAVQLGGSVCFPSGHLTTLVVANGGFIALHKRYMLFLWRPPHSSETYMVAESYLIEDDDVFPINTEADVSAYEHGMPLDKFEARVKAAIAANVDAN